MDRTRPTRWLNRWVAFSLVVGLLPATEGFSGRLAAPSLTSYTLDLTRYDVRNGKAFLEGTLTSPKKKETLISLKQGECFDNLCLIGPAKKRGFYYQVGQLTEGKWEIFDIGSVSYFELEALIGEIADPKKVYDVFQMVFPNNRFMGENDLIYHEGRWRDKALVEMPLCGIKDWDIGKLLNKIKNARIRDEKGVPVLGPPRKNCNQFRAQFLDMPAGSDPTESVMIPYFEKLVLIACTTEDGKPGYCSSQGNTNLGSAFISSECEPIAEEPNNVKLSECGGPIGTSENPSQYVWNNEFTPLRKAQARVRNGNTCNDASEMSALVEIKFPFPEGVDPNALVPDPGGGPPRPPEAPARLFPLQFASSSGKKGICFEGQCVPSDLNFCKSTTPTLRLKIESTEAAQWAGSELVESLHPDQKTNQMIPQTLIDEVHKRMKDPKQQDRHNAEEGKRNGMSCPGGTCQNGKCDPLEKPASTFEQNPPECAEKEDGDGCDFGVSEGYCFQKKCLKCENGQLLNVPSCPPNDLFPNASKARRKSCISPRVCQYL